jgi:hypothetical protein
LPSHAFSAFGPNHVFSAFARTCIRIHIVMSG